MMRALKSAAGWVTMIWSRGVGFARRNCTLPMLAYLLSACALGLWWRDACVAGGLLGSDRGVGLRLDRYVSIAFCLGSGLTGLMLRSMIVRSVRAMLWAAFLFPLLGAMAFWTSYGVVMGFLIGRDMSALGFALVAWVAAFIAGHIMFPMGLVSVVVLWPAARWSKGLPLVAGCKSPRTSP
jgi:hypothetical protein